MAGASPEIWSVSQITRRIKSTLENEIGSVWLSGEISNWKVAASGHAYFTLKDADAQIDAVMFKGKLGRLRFEPESGLEVLAHGNVSVYERRGNYQIILSDMQPKGLGALQLAFEKLKKKLGEEGLFDEGHKKPLPLLPKKIGIVTSPTGAAIRDILNVLGRRFANVHVLLHPARVQGDGAAEEIAHGIRVLDEYGVDVMIVGRGGGSLEDLWPFNEEAVVRAVFECNTPVISAVGHEIDYALSDFAADVRAPTPSAAAEIVVKEHQALVEQIGQLRQRLANATEQRLTRTRYRLDQCKNSFVYRRPEELFRQHRMRLDDLDLRLRDVLLESTADARARLDRAAGALRFLSPGNQVQRARERLLVLESRLAQSAGSGAERGRNRLAALSGRLNALSPLAILGRGYALAWKDGVLVRDAASLQPGDEIAVRFGEGEAGATVNEIKEGGLSLDDSLKQFEEGIKLARRCEKALGEAEKKIEVLTQNEDGEVETEPFDEDDPPETPKRKPKAKAKAERKPSSDEIPPDAEEDEDGELLF